MRPTPFSIISRARSGTNFLISKLQLTNKVICGWEPFNQPFYGFDDLKHLAIPADVLQKMNDQTFRDRDPDGYLEYILGLTGALDNTNVTASGFKIFPEHNLDRWWKTTSDPRISAIVLQRYDVLASYSSFKIAYQTKDWAHLKSQQRPKGPQHKIVFDAGQFQQFKFDHESTYEKVLANLTACGARYLHVSYEDLTADPSSIKQIYDFLNLGPVEDKESFLEVQNDTNVLNRFTNPEDAAPFVWPGR